MVVINNIVCQEIKSPVIIWQWPARRIFFCMLQFLLYFCHIKSFFGTGFFYRFLSAAAKIEAVFFKNLRFAYVFCCYLAYGFIFFSGHIFSYFHFPPFRALFQVFPFKNIAPFSQQLIINWFGVMIIMNNKAF